MGSIGILVAGNLAVAALLALAAILAQRGQASPRLVHGLWLLVLLKLVTPTLLPIEVGQPAVDRVSDSIVEPGGQEQIARLDRGVDWAAVESLRPTVGPWWFGWLLGIWVGGAALSLGRSVQRGIVAARALRRIDELDVLDTNDVRKLVAQIANRIGLRRLPSVRVVTLAAGPFTWVGRSGARLVLPVDWLAGSTVGQRRAVIAHELAHLHYRHHWTRTFERVVSAIYWWCPLVWFARPALRQAEEEACDAKALELFPEHSAEFATALLTAAAQAPACRSLPMQAMAWNQASSLERRIRRALTPCGRRPWHNLGRRLLLIASVVAMSLSAAPGRVDDQVDGVSVGVRRDAVSKLIEPAGMTMVPWSDDELEQIVSAGVFDAAEVEVLIDVRDLESDSLSSDELVRLAMREVDRVVQRDPTLRAVPSVLRLAGDRGERIDRLVAVGLLTEVQAESLQARWGIAPTASTDSETR